MYRMQTHTHTYKHTAPPKCSPQALALSHSCTQTHHVVRDEALNHVVLVALHGQTQHTHCRSHFRNLYKSVCVCMCVHLFEHMYVCVCGRCV